MTNKFSNFGIPDEIFTRNSVPMTKEEVRAVIFSKLRVLDNNKILDIGSGTGTLSIQAALFAKNGIVYSIEKDQNAIELINENITKLQIKNIKIIKDTAPKIDSDLKDFDRIIIGGSGGNLKSILEWSYDILKSSGRIVIPANIKIFRKNCYSCNNIKYFKGY
jgi:precorrin-6Y C5,15-methyltransferase (decarboxylating) CbiT subunit